MYDQFLRWLEATTLGSTISENDMLFPWIEAIHVLAIVTVIGSIFIVDLRLLGLASRERHAHRLMTEILPVTWAAFGLAAITGLLLFTAKAVSYGYNAFFWRKMVLMAFAALNMLVFHYVTGKDIERTGGDARLPNATRAAGAVSLLLWIAIVACGRWIGFTLR